MNERNGGIYHNIDDYRSYATRFNLEAALRKFGLLSVNHVVVWTSKGRVTAVFGKGFLDSADIPPIHVAHLGFMVIG